MDDGYRTVRLMLHPDCAWAFTQSPKKILWQGKMFCQRIFLPLDCSN